MNLDFFDPNITINGLPSPLPTTVRNIRGPSCNTQLQSLADFDEISSEHKQNLRCASVHLVSGCTVSVHLTFWVRKSKYGYFLYVMLRNNMVKQMLH